MILDSILKIEYKPISLKIEDDIDYEVRDGKRLSSTRMVHVAQNNV